RCDRIQIGDVGDRALIELLPGDGGESDRGGLRALLAKLRGDDHFLELGIATRRVRHGGRIRERGLTREGPCKANSHYGRHQAGTIVRRHSRPPFCFQMRTRSVDDASGALCSGAVGLCKYRGTCGLRRGMDSFSTFGLPASRKIAYWNELTSETFAQAEIRALDVSQFDARLNRAPIGPVTLIDVRCAAVRVQRTRAHVARTSMPSYLLVTPLQGEFELRLEHSPAIRVRTGEFCLIDHARPYEFVHGYGVNTLCVDFPRRAIEERISGVERLVGRLMTSESAMSRLLVALLFNLSREL